MEITKLCKSTCNNQLQQSICLCQKKNMSQIWQVNTLGRAKVKGHTMMYTYTPYDQCPYQVSTFYTLQDPRNSPEKILKHPASAGKYPSPQVQLNEQKH